MDEDEDVMVDMTSTEEEDWREEQKNEKGATLNYVLMSSVYVYIIGYLKKQPLQKLSLIVEMRRLIGCFGVLH